MNTNRVRYENKTRIVSTLVMAGLSIAGIAYTPAAHQKADVVVVGKYLHGQKLYSPQRWYADWKVSEQRRVAMQKVVAARVAIRDRARAVTKVHTSPFHYHVAAIKERYGHAGKLMENIVTLKQIS